MKIRKIMMKTVSLVIIKKENKGTGGEDEKNTNKTISHIQN